MTDLEVYEVLCRYGRAYYRWGLDPMDVAHEAYLRYRSAAPDEVNLAYLGLMTRGAAGKLYRRAMDVPARLDEQVSREDTLADLLPSGYDLEAVVMARLDLLRLAQLAWANPRVLLLIPPLVYYANRELGPALGLSPLTLAQHRATARRALRTGAEQPHFALGQRVVELARGLAGR